MRRASRAGMLVGLLAAFGAAACHGPERFYQPLVALHDVRLRGLGLSGGAADVVLSVYNPNGYRVDAQRLTYQLFVDTLPFGTGTYDRPFALRKRDSTLVALPLTFTYAGIGRSGREIMNTGTVNYRVVGAMTMRTPMGEFTRPFDRTARLSTLDLSPR